MMFNNCITKYKSLRTETASEMPQTSLNYDNSRNAILTDLREEHEWQTTLVSIDLCNRRHIRLHISVTYSLTAAVTWQLYMVMILSLCSTSTDSREITNTV